MTSSSSIPPSNANASLKWNNVNQWETLNPSNESQRSRPDSMSAAQPPISTIPIEIHSPQLNDDDDRLFSAGPSSRSSSSRRRGPTAFSIDSLQSRFSTLFGGIGRKNRYNGNDANIMALSCTAADEEIAPLSPNRAERIIKNDETNHDTSAEYMEQRAELLKGIDTVLFFYHSHLNSNQIHFRRARIGFIFIRPLRRLFRFHFRRSQTGPSAQYYDFVCSFWFV